VTLTLLALNIAAYIWVAFTGGFGDTRSLLEHGALYGPLVTRGEYWRIVTAAFLHGGLLHIALNMFALMQVGSYLEALVGSARMLAIYTVALIGSGIAVVLFSPNDVTVGASGAIFGIFGALVAIGIRLGPRGRDLIAQTLPIVGLNLAFGFSIPNISNAGHIGGLVSGFLAGLAIFMVRPGDAVREARPFEREGGVPETIDAGEPGRDEASIAAAPQAPPRR
jgi:rhomboid protease GluP